MNPIYVDTQLAEFNYPSGSENVQTRYEGTGGIPIDGLGMRVVAALAHADRNVLLKELSDDKSRMMIRRNVREECRRLLASWSGTPTRT